jgi:3-hydroxyacyl-CoA dehydrogenase
MPAETINDVATYEVTDKIAVVSINNPPVNALGQKVREGLIGGVSKAVGDDGVEAIVLWCDGRTFHAGADITEFGKPMQPPGLNEVLDVIEDSPKPVVAAIHGTAFGGGLEVALACSHRVAVPSAKVGLPEVKLGIIPGGGGTQRLPRVVDIEMALEMITKGDPVPAPKAAKFGAIDEIVDENDLKGGAIAFAKKAAAAGTPPKVRDRIEKLDAARANPGVFDEFRKKNARKFRGFLAPEGGIKAIEAAVNLPFDDGIAEERRIFTELMASDQSDAQRYVFFAERQAAKLPKDVDGSKTREIKKVGVLGAGTMGGGISMNFLNAGIPVTIVEREQEALDRGLKVIRGNYERSAKGGRMTMDDVETRMGLLTPSLDKNDFADCDMIIEAVFENMDLKKEIFAELDGIAKQGAILASNTSYLNIDEIGAATKRPEDVIGTHFFSPANVMRLLEVVRGEKTADDVIATVMKLAKPIGKAPVLCRVCHGFIGNRMLAKRQFEANQLVLEGVMPWDIDRVLYDFGLPMGPFAMGDLAGLDIGWNKETSKGETLRDRLCEMDRRGQKTGAGFYDYDENRKATPSPVVEKLIKDFVAEKGVQVREVSDQEILERCIYPMINEGAKILEEGIAQRGSDVDIVWLYGYGWPVYRGGPMCYADQTGLSSVVERLEHYASTLGPDRFAPAELLKKLAKDGGKLREYQA